MVDPLGYKIDYQDSSESDLDPEDVNYKVKLKARKNRKLGLCKKKKKKKGDSSEAVSEIDDNEED